MPEKIATYRLQLHPGFGFMEAIQTIDYLASLGISHLYISPCLQAVSGSMHGYDIVDHCKINEELGGEEGHQAFCLAVQAAGMGIVADIVPNHMAIEGKQNPWWWDVLENGPSSPFATFFDVDWDASEERWPNKILLPILDDHYGRVLENGQLQLIKQEGSILLQYAQQLFPLDPSSLAGIYGKAGEVLHSDLLIFLAESHSRLPRPTVTQRKLVERRRRDKAVLQELLGKICREDPQVNSAINAEIERLNSNTDALDALIDQQNYRLAFWRTVSRDLGYRRFFDIKDLIGLKMEDPELFLMTHALPISWFSKGWIEGFRVDHPDGLRNPREYFDRLATACPGAWILAEKIVEQGETIPNDWKIAGTTGYDFLNQVEQLFIDPKGQEKMTQIYHGMVNTTSDFHEQLFKSKYFVVTNLFGSEVNRLSTLLTEICEKHRRYRDYIRPELKEALCLTAACFPVYRSYVSTVEKRVSLEDEKVVVTAIQTAMNKRPELDSELFDFLEKILLLRIEGALEGEFAMRFQQLTGAVMAKGMEDTAFYRYNRLIALNEVGGNPACFGISLEQFHAWCLQAQEKRPYSLLASSTHDTKRSEDVRARLALLSEIPDKFGAAIQRFSSFNEHFRTQNLPDRNTEYLFYQTLIGTWPIPCERISTYMEKAVREAKEYTSWTNPDKNYEQCLAHFINEAMHNETFLYELKDFLSLLINPGRIVSLAQTLIKCTAPGIPDIYQGCELWDLHLVDPDNRTDVDFYVRKQMLQNVKHLTLNDTVGMDDGMIKLWMIHQLLNYRKNHCEVFSPKGNYTPLYAEGKKAEHAIAFMRGEQAITIAPRLLLQLADDWSDTIIRLPKGSWSNIFTKDSVKDSCSLQHLLKKFPMALLTRE